MRIENRNRGGGDKVSQEVPSAAQFLEGSTRHREVAERPILAMPKPAVPQSS